MARNPRRRYTQEMLKAQAQGRQIVAATSMIDPNTRTRQIHVRYAPRYLTDPRPWIETYASGDGIIRYCGGEVTLEARYLVDKIDHDYFQVFDIEDGTVHGVFSGTEDGESSYRRADLCALYLNREDRREVIGHAA